MKHLELKSLSEKVQQQLDNITRKKLDDEQEEKEHQVIMDTPT